GRGGGRAGLRHHLRGVVARAPVGGAEGGGGRAALLGGDERSVVDHGGRVLARGGPGLVDAGGADLGGGGLVLGRAVGEALAFVLVLLVLAAAQQEHDADDAADDEQAADDDEEEQGARDAALLGGLGGLLRRLGGLGLGGGRLGGLGGLGLHRGQGEVPLEARVGADVEFVLEVLEALLRDRQPHRARRDGAASVPPEGEVAVGVGARLVLAALAVGEDDLRVGDGLGVRGDVAGDLGDRRPAVPDDGDVGLLDPVALSAGVELELALLLLALGQIGFGG